jgi:hypothetical protein
LVFSFLFWKGRFYLGDLVFEESGEDAHLRVFPCALAPQKKKGFPKRLLTKADYAASENLLTSNKVWRERRGRGW